MSGPPARRTATASPDLPTLAIAVAVYGGWLAATAFHDRLPAPALALVGGWFVAWHGSLQHETIHGRPTGVRWVDALVGGWPLSLWLPYARYRDSHLGHHATEHLTHPEHDPESRYLRAGAAGRRAVAGMGGAAAGDDSRPAHARAHFRGRRLPGA